MGRGQPGACRGGVGCASLSSRVRGVTGQGVALNSGREALRAEAVAGETRATPGLARAPLCRARAERGTVWVVAKTSQLLPSPQVPTQPSPGAPLRPVRCWSSRYPTTQPCPKIPSPVGHRSDRQCCACRVQGGPLECWGPQLAQGCPGQTRVRLGDFPREVRAELSGV